jgi:hypothetical protein
VIVQRSGTISDLCHGKRHNDGSQAHPFATLQQAASVVTPGTPVHVLPGIYTDPVTLTSDGIAQARIIFRSETRWGAKIKTTGSQAPWITRADYIDIVGFDVTSSGSRDGIDNQSSFIRTIGNHVHDIPGGCDSTGGSGIDDGNYQAHDDDIIGNVVDHIGETYLQLCLRRGGKKAAHRQKILCLLTVFINGCILGT